MMMSNLRNNRQSLMQSAPECNHSVEVFCLEASSQSLSLEPMQATCCAPQ